MYTNLRLLNSSCVHLSSTSTTDNGCLQQRLPCKSHRRAHTYTVSRDEVSKSLTVYTILCQSNVRTPVLIVATADCPGPAVYCYMLVSYKLSAGIKRRATPRGRLPHAPPPRQATPTSHQLPVTARPPLQLPVRYVDELTISWTIPQHSCITLVNLDTCWSIHTC